MSNLRASLNDSIVLDTFEDHCETCGTVAVREAFYFEGIGEWHCEHCGEVTVWNALDALRLRLR